jgi:two-component system sensor histidine kinase/response regulator
MAWMKVNLMDVNNKILIIDDEDIVINSCTQILKSGDYNIITAKNGEDGLKLLKQENPDLVFVDLKMPGLSGFEVLDLIHDYDPTIVTIVITGFATVSSAVEAMKKGTFDFLPKPFTPDELRLITVRGLDRRRLILETITLRQEKEMLREHFAAIVSHELKSPLGALQQNLYVLIDDISDLLTEDQMEKLKRLQTRISDLVKMVNTWLSSISVDVSSIQENFKETSIPMVISKVVDIMEDHARRKDIEILTSIADNILDIYGDEVTLVEALVNIVNNAVKYSRIGGQISIAVDASGEFINISVTDNGVGIAKDDIPLIFQDFYVGKSKIEGERRSGVGLAITRRIIEAHNGNISVESELGSGSTFIIHLPINHERITE